MKSKTAKIEQKVVINNEAGHFARVLIEPWAEEVSISPGDKVSFTGNGPATGACFELEFGKDLLIVHAWPGAKVMVRHNDTVLETASKDIEAI